MEQKQAGLARFDAEAPSMKAADSNEASQLETQGFCILPQVFGAADIARFRAAVMREAETMGQTRNVAHARHLAGFHRFPKFAGLHAELVAEPGVNALLDRYYGGDSFYAIGLTDITINRSQHWHTDLLRGTYSHFLQDDLPWQAGERGCIKALVYLQSGKSLRIVPGSHLSPTPLDDVALERMAEQGSYAVLDVAAGEVVMIDIRSLHRGSTDAEMAAPALAHNPKILISTVFGAIHSRFAQAMQIGNAHRMQDWDARNLK